MRTFFGCWPTGAFGCHERPRLVVAENEALTLSADGVSAWSFGGCALGVSCSIDAREGGLPETIVFGCLANEG